MSGFYNSFHVLGKTQAKVCELIKSLKNDDRGKCIVAPKLINGRLFMWKPDTVFLLP
ncbi:MAG: hypothetical protein LBU34_05360 [Planctomycetaceae bacterium]|jgi:hypothetical protein|nr:hypothetical protein [Planctomycetaceae bacterium]